MVARASSLYASLARLETLRAMDPRSNIVRWTAPRSAFFPDPSGDAPPALAAALRAEGARLIEDAPADVRAAFASRAGNSCRFLSPATVRALLRESRPHPSLDSRESALALLAYCISDVDPDDASSASDLRGTPLVPLADGTLGVFAFRDPDDADSHRGTDAHTPTFHIPDVTEFAFLARGVANVLVDVDACATISGVTEKLVAMASRATGAALNLSLVDARALASFLPATLPATWRSPDGRGCGRTVAWRADGSNGDPDADALALLWRRLAATSPETLTAFEGWPLLPVDDGDHLAPLVPHGPIVRGEGWTEPAADALAAMGVRRLRGEGVVAAAIVAHPLVATYVRPASAAGVLDGAVAAAATDESTAALVPVDASPERRWRAAAAAVPRWVRERADPPARRALRAFLAQNKWFEPRAAGGKLEGARLDLLRSLPIFETRGNRKVCGVRNGRENAAEHSDSGTRADHHSDAASEEDSSRFVALDASPAPMLAPSDADPSLLCAAFLRVGGDAEANLLETRCGVTRASLATVLADFALPALAAGELPSSAAPRALDAAFASLAAARAAWTGAADVEKLETAIRRHACVPTPCGARSRVRPTCSILASNVSERFWILANVSRRRPSTPAIASRRSPSWACARLSARRVSSRPRDRWRVWRRQAGTSRARWRAGARSSTISTDSRRRGMTRRGMTRYPRRIPRRMRSRETRIATTARPSRCGASWDPSRGVPC